MKKVIVVGGGLAGLSCAFYLSKEGFQVHLMEAAPYLGGRTSSWIEDGMPVESGLHRYVSCFRHLPSLLEQVGLDLDEVFYWEDEIELSLPDGETIEIDLPSHTSFSLLSSITKKMGIVETVLRNNKLLSPKEKLLLTKFFLKGMADLKTNPDKLDGKNILEYAHSADLPERLIERIIFPTSTGIFYIQPEHYSAYAFFGLFAPYTTKAKNLKVGAFRGGMSDVMIDPIAKKIKENGGIILTSTKVEELIYENNKVSGVMAKGKEHKADHVIVATSLLPAQHILKKPFSTHKWFKPFFNLTSRPVSTIQIELNKRSTGHEDRTNFSPLTCLASYAEQSESTFTHVPGRLSIILNPAEKFLNKSPEQTLKDTLHDLNRIGVKIDQHIKDYRIVNIEDACYSSTPGSEKLRPAQETPIKGLTLAGDYTKQEFLATMEGAAYSGEQAAAIVKKNLT